LREPTTAVTVSRAADAPTKLIWLRYEASTLPGSGETVTAPPARAAERLSAGGAQAGPRVAPAPAGTDSAITAAIAPAGSASAATKRWWRRDDKPGVRIRGRLPPRSSRASRGPREVRILS